MSRPGHGQPSQLPAHPMTSPAYGQHQTMSKRGHGQSRPRPGQVTSSSAHSQFSTRPCWSITSPAHGHTSQCSAQPKVGLADAQPRPHSVESIERPELASPYPGQHMETPAHYPSPCLTQPIARLSCRWTSHWSRHPTPGPARVHPTHLPTQVTGWPTTRPKFSKFPNFQNYKSFSISKISES
jgi:hypothetical protein